MRISVIFSTNQSSEKLTALQLFWQNSSVITNSWTKCFETSLKSQIFPIHKYIFMNGKSQYPVFFKNHAAVTPELVVNRLRRINTYIWLFNKSYSQHKCQFVQKTFGNTGQQQDAIRISVPAGATYIIYILSWRQISVGRFYVFILKPIIPHFDK